MNRFVYYVLWLLVLLVLGYLAYLNIRSQLGIVAFAVVALSFWYVVGRIRDTVLER
ncbi:MAG: hypothetical protein V1744_07280 [Candidatus Altiarchaeota archaeon]